MRRRKGGVEKLKPGLYIHNKPTRLRAGDKVAIATEYATGKLQILLSRTTDTSEHGIYGSSVRTGLHHCLSGRDINSDDTETIVGLIADIAGLSATETDRSKGMVEFKLE